MATRFRMPFEYSPMIFRSACSWNSSINSPARSIAVGRGSPYILPTNSRNSTPVSRSKSSDSSGTSPIRFLISSSSPGSLKPRISMLPPSDGNQARQHPDGRRLARAVGPQKSEERSPRHFQVHAIHGGLKPVRFSKIAHQDGGGHPSSLRCFAGPHRRPPVFPFVCRPPLIPWCILGPSWVTRCDQHQR